MNPIKYKSKQEAEKALKDARKYLAQANITNNRAMIQKWFKVCESIREQIAKF